MRPDVKRQIVRLLTIDLVIVLLLAYAGFRVAVAVGYFVR